ncbi:hypothetical protein [Reinekea sp. G2M2-21]|uniref:hypothetical protein n=1 Tax=Reinekea sp. G2M2-21 TaxID=2788942 RepID=UPI0018A8B101|nr:hypothetical protein [Reinekea sp. G2M2-21]
MPILPESSDFQFQLRGMLTPADRALIFAENDDCERVYLTRSKSIRQNSTELKQAAKDFPATSTFSVSTGAVFKDAQGVYLSDPAGKSSWKVRKLLIDLSSNEIAPVGQFGSDFDYWADQTRIKAA